MSFTLIANRIKKTPKEITISIGVLFLKKFTEH